MAPDLKKPCLPVKIGTHSGTFHCDEALAVFLLKLLPEYKNATIIRSRDPKVLKDCDIVVDVGGEYDPSRNRFDHHQREFQESMNSLSKGSKPWITRLSSAGLVYFHFGERILKELLAEDSLVHLGLIFDKVYENLIEEIDAVDNGISTHDGPPRYRVTTTLSSRVKRLNPAWNEKSPEPEDSRFEKAMTLVGEEFLDRVIYFASCWLPARSLVKEAILTRHQVDESGEVIELAQGGCPWQDHLFSLEEELDVNPPIKLVVFPDTSAGSWRVQSVPIFVGSFHLRLPLKEEWRGLRDSDLSDKSGIPNCIFVHTTGFIGGNKTRQGAIDMAKQTLLANKTS